MAFPATPLPVKVYAAPGAAPGGAPTTWSWIDITSDVLVRDGITIESGRADEATQVDASKATMSINNAGGHYSTRNPLGRWYGRLRRNTPLRVALAAITDTFTRNSAGTLGIADTGQQWLTPIGVNPIGYTTNGTTARINPSTTRAPRPYLDGLSVLDSDITVSIRVPYAPTGDGVSAGVGVRWRNGDAPSAGVNGYVGALYFPHDPAEGGVLLELLIMRPVDGLGRLNFFAERIPHVLNATYKLRIRTEGAYIALKYWNATSGAEPEIWQIARTVSEMSRPGSIALRGAVNVNNTNVEPFVDFDDLHVELDLMTGTVPEWPPRWDRSGRDAWTPIVAAGILRRLAQGPAPLRSPLVRQMLAQSPTVYIPFEDGSEANQYASSLVTGAAPATTIGVTFGEDASLPGATCVATCSAATQIVAKAPPHSVAGGWTFVVFAKLSNLPPAEFQLFQLDTPGGRIKRWEVLISVDTITCRGLDTDGTVLLGSARSISTENTDVRRWMAYQIKLTTTGTSTSFQCYLYPLIDPKLVTFYGLGVNVGTATYTGAPGSLVAARITGATGWINGMVGHLFYAAHPNVEFISYDFLNAAWGYTGELAAARVRRLCNEEGIPVFIEPGESEPMGRQPSATFLELLRQTEAADLGVLREVGAGLGYKPRGARYNQDVELALDFRMGTDDGDIAEPPEPTDDDQRVRNDITVSRDGGGSAHAVDEDHIAAEGRYDEAFTLNLPDDTRLDGHAHWRLSLGRTDELRWPRIVLDIASRPELFARVLSLRVGSRVTIANPPDEVAGDEIDLIVEGLAYELGPFTFRVVLSCSPAAPWQVGVIGTARVDSSASQLYDDHAPDWQDLLVRTAGGSWTQRLAAYPFDLFIAGERARAVAPGYATEWHRFDDSLDGWIAAEGGTLTLARDVVRRGTGAARFVPSGTSASASIRAGDTGAPIDTGGFLDAGAWIYATAAWSDMRLIVEYFTAAGTYIDGHGYDGAPFTVPALTWTHFYRQMPAIVPANAATARLRVLFASTPPASTTFYVDHAVVIYRDSLGPGPIQSITAERSVNGIAKTHPAGTPVRLWRPSRIAL